MENIKIYTISILLIMNISLSFGIIYFEHLTRSQNRELQILENEKNIIKDEWKKERIEEVKYASHSIIEKKAKELLNMSLPKNRVLINIDD